MESIVTSAIIVSKYFFNIGGLDNTFNEQDLYNFFITFGEIKSIEIIINNTENLKQAIVYFKNAGDASSAIENTHLNKLKGQTVMCKLFSNK